MKWYFIGLALLGLAAIFGGGYGIGWGLRAASDAKAVANAQGNFDTCKATNSTQADALTKIGTLTKTEKSKADALKSQAVELLQSRPGAMAAIEKQGREVVAAIGKQGHEDADSANLARLPVPSALARRLWPSSAASTGAPASH